MAGYRFQRQFAIGFYIVDFVCRAEKLIVELDGAHHAEADQEAYDQVRTKFLAAQGFRVLRFWNGEVESAMPTVLQKITMMLQPPAPESCHVEVNREQANPSDSPILSPSSFGRGEG